MTAPMQHSHTSYTTRLSPLMFEFMEVKGQTTMCRVHTAYLQHVIMGHVRNIATGCLCHLI